MKSVCWRGPPGSGKRFALQKELAKWASSMGQVYTVKRGLWDAPIQGGEENNSDDEDSDEKPLLPMESSILHWGFDIARMSLQDKQFIKSILAKWGKGSQVLSNGNSKRCLVFYHAHLLSSESILFLQAFLEENHQDSALWLTSEHPLPPRLADWCKEIAVPGPVDLSLKKFGLETSITLEDEILSIYDHWIKEQPCIADVKKIRAIVYALLHRNIRWTEGFHNWMFACDKLPLTQEQKIKVAEVCIKQPFTGPGQTVPSYRIPVLWESYLCGLRNALAPAPVPLPSPPAKKNR
jgi:hypothetical protein